MTRKINQWLLFSGIYMWSAAASAFGTTSGGGGSSNRDIQLTASGEAGFDAVTAFLNKILSFMTGPWATFVIAVSLIAGVAVWVWEPQSKALGWVARILIAGVLIFQVGALVGLIGGQV
ncbi:MAG: hypothetical protein HKM24_04495 [Gammaproteobacteria bacterium]|nr:hypothetical protein [Gammaproteobacteria bacterium]